MIANLAAIELKTSAMIDKIIEPFTSRLLRLLFSSVSA